jgi:hypothetical protein
MWPGLPGGQLPAGLGPASAVPMVRNQVRSATGWLAVHPVVPEDRECMLGAKLPVLDVDVEVLGEAAHG